MFHSIDPRPEAFGEKLGAQANSQDGNDAGVLRLKPGKEMVG